MDDNILFFDLETTGTNISTDRIVSLSAIKTNKSFKILDRKKLLINPTIPIPKESSDIHGITDEIVKDALPFRRYAKGVYEFFTSCGVIGGYNIKKFDIPLLIEEFLRCDIDYKPPNEIIDPYVVFREKEPRHLTAALKFYCGITEFDGAHDAEKDNEATIQVLESQMFFYSDISNIEDAIKFCINSDSKNKNKVDYAGKIVLNDEGIACYSFGQHKGKPVISEKGFAEWMLSPLRDFSLNTKNVVRSLIANK